MTLQQIKEQEIAEFEKNLQIINHRGMADIPSTIGYFRQAVLRLEQAIREEERRMVEDIFEKHGLGIGVGAIPETTDYANGWNECRKEAYERKKKLVQEIKDNILLTLK